MEKENDILRENSKKLFENIVEFSVDGIYKSKIPVKSNISSIKEIEGNDNIFYINHYQNITFGISKEVINNLNEIKSFPQNINSHYIMPGHIHIDPENWNKIKNGNNEIEVTLIFKNNFSKKIKMIETDSKTEIENAKKIISSEKYSQICKDFKKTLNKNPIIKHAMNLRM